MTLYPLNMAYNSSPDIILAQWNTKNFKQRGIIAIRWSKGITHQNTSNQLRLAGKRGLFDNTFALPLFDHVIAIQHDVCYLYATMKIMDSKLVIFICRDDLCSRRDWNFKQRFQSWRFSWNL